MCLAALPSLCLPAGCLSLLCAVLSSAGCLPGLHLPRKGRCVGLYLGRIPYRLSPGVQAWLFSCRVPEAQAPLAAQQHVQRAATTPTQVQQTGLGCLQIHWAQWRIALFQVQRAKAQEAGLMHRPGISSRGSLLLLLDAPAPWKQVRGNLGGMGCRSNSQDHWPLESAHFSPWW